MQVKKKRRGLNEKIEREIVLERAAKAIKEAPKNCIKQVDNLIIGKLER
jgi:hypothetical protein